MDENKCSAWITRTTQFYVHGFGSHLWPMVVWWVIVVLDWIWVLIGHRTMFLSSGSLFTAETNPLIQPETCKDFWISAWKNVEILQEIQWNQSSTKETSSTLAGTGNGQISKWFWLGVTAPKSQAASQWIRCLPYLHCEVQTRRIYLDGN